MKKLFKIAIIMGMVFTVLLVVAVFLIKYWEKLLPVVFAGKEAIDSIIKSLIPEKQDEDDMSDYDDI